jgi:hypothetical protein
MDHLFQFGQELQFLYQTVCSIIRLAQERSQSDVEVLTSIRDVLKSEFVIAWFRWELNLLHCHEEISFVRVLLNLLGVLFKAVPVLKIPRGISRIGCDFPNLLLDLHASFLVRLSIIALPNFSDQGRQFFPTHELTVTIKSFVLEFNFLIWWDRRLTDPIEQFLPFLTLLFDFEVIVLDKV